MKTEVSSTAFATSPTSAPPPYLDAGLGRRNFVAVSFARGTRGGGHVALDDCDRVRDLYTDCVMAEKVDSALCSAAVKSYLSCSRSDK